MTTNWLRDLARTSLGDFEVSDELDRRLSELAEWAQLRSGTSFELLGLLAWKIERFVWRFHAWDLEPYDLDDVAQEAYLVFVDTIRRWAPRYVQGVSTGYLYYFLEVFPHWLASRVRRWRRRTRPPVVRLVRKPAAGATEMPEFCRNLSPEETTLVELRLRGGLSIPRAADEMGIARTTAYRRWNRILELGREYVREAG